MNQKYRQVVETLFRRSYPQIVIATGTLVLDVNMPCNTVVFAEDSAFLIAFKLCECAVRAGRRESNLLGNVLFPETPLQRVFHHMSSRLPHLNGYLPITTSLVLQLATLVYGLDKSLTAICSLSTF
jgi:superfamily II RNA helicase